MTLMNLIRDHSVCKEQKEITINWYFYSSKFRKIWPFILLFVLVLQIYHTLENPLWHGWILIGCFSSMIIGFGYGWTATLNQNNHSIHITKSFFGVPISHQKEQIERFERSEKKTFLGFYRIYLKLKNGQKITIIKRRGQSKLDKFWTMFLNLFPELCNA